MGRLIKSRVQGILSNENWHLKKKSVKEKEEGELSPGGRAMGINVKRHRRLEARRYSIACSFSTTEYNTGRHINEISAMHITAEVDPKGCIPCNSIYSIFFNRKLSIGVEEISSCQGLMDGERTTIKRDSTMEVGDQLNCFVF